MGNSPSMNSSGRVEVLPHSRCAQLNGSACAAAGWLHSVALVALVSQARLSAQCCVTGPSIRQETTSISSAIGRSVVSCTSTIRCLGHYSSVHISFAIGTFSLEFMRVQKKKTTFGSWTRETTLPTKCTILHGEGGVRTDVLGKETSLAVLHYAEYCSNRHDVHAFTDSTRSTLRGRLWKVLSQMTIMASEAGPKKRTGDEETVCKKQWEVYCVKTALGFKSLDSLTQTPGYELVS